MHKHDIGKHKIIQKIVHSTKMCSKLLQNTFTDLQTTLKMCTEINTILCQRKILGHNTSS